MIRIWRMSFQPIGGESDRVGKYGADVKGFDAFLDTIPFMDKSYGLVIMGGVSRDSSFDHRNSRVM